MTTITSNTSNRSRTLLITAALLGGAAAGPLFLVAATIQGATRPDYDPWRDSISALALGSPLGWIQSLNFILVGLLMIGLSVGLSRAVRQPSFWGPVLIGVWGAGALTAGILPTDPDPAYPPRPDLAADLTTMPGLIHNWSAGLGFSALFVATLVFARWFARNQHRGWAWYSAISGSVFLIFTFLHNYFGRRLDESWSDFGGLFQRCAVLVGFAWLTAIAVRFVLLRLSPERP